MAFGTSLRRRALSGAAGLVAVGAGIGLFFLQDSQQRAKAYEGVIQKRSSELRRRINSGSNVNRNKAEYFWTIARTDAAGKGLRENVKVPRSVYDSAREGDKVIKIAGERYPKKANPAP